MNKTTEKINDMIAVLRNKGEYSDKRIATAEDLIENGGTKIYQALTDIMRDTNETHDLRYEIASVLTRAANQRIAMRAERMLAYMDWESDDRPDKPVWKR